MGEEHSKQREQQVQRSLGRILSSLCKGAREPVWLERSGQGQWGKHRRMCNKEAIHRDLAEEGSGLPTPRAMGALKGLSKEVT